MNTKHIPLTLLFLSLFFINSFAQSTFAKIEAADKYYNQKDYANAAILYSKVLYDTSKTQSRVLPYKIQMVNLSIMPKDVKKADAAAQKDTSSTGVKDSTANATPVVAPIKKEVTPVDTNKTTGNTAMDPKNPSKYDYVLNRLASSYLLNADYGNAAATYKKVVERNIYPNANYFYALALMNTRKYQDALNVFETFVSSPNSNDSLVAIARKKEAGCYLAMDSNKINRNLKINKLDTNEMCIRDSTNCIDHFLQLGFWRWFRNLNCT